MKKDIEIEAGCCPVCGSPDISYKNNELGADCILYPWSCSVCKSSGEEVYRIEFVGHETKTIRGKQSYQWMPE